MKPGLSGQLLLLATGLVLPVVNVLAANSDITIARPVGEEGWSLPLQTLVLLSGFTFIPGVLLMMTGFTRIVIVFGLLRNALGTPTAPPNQVIVGLALFLTFFVMSPVFTQIYDKAWLPLQSNSLTMEEALAEGVKPLHAFMLDQTRERDLAMFANMAKKNDIDTANDVPLSILVPAFITSELKTAFQIGFTIFIPFLIIDLVVASILMALGMMMVPPTTIALPFKLMLFVLVDGWQLIIGSLAQSFFS